MTRAITTNIAKDEGDALLERKTFSSTANKAYGAANTGKIDVGAVGGSIVRGATSSTDPRVWAVVCIV